MSDTAPSADASEEPEESESWSLVRTTSPIPELGLATTLNEIRRLEASEHQRVIEAEELLNRFGPTWPHTTAVRLAGAITQALDRLEKGRALAGGQVNESDLNRLSEALGTFAEHLTGWVVDASSTPGPIGDAASAASVTMPVVFCQRIAGGDIPVLVARQPRQVGMRLDGCPEVSPIWLAKASLDACRSVADTELVEAEPSILAAGAVIMGLRAEVVWGEPTILLTPNAPSETLSLTPQPVEWRRVEPILIACAIARKALNQSSEGHAPTGRATDQPPVVPGLPPESPSEPSDGGVSTAPEQGPSGEDSSIDPPPELADIAAFVHEATSLAQSTEQRWSDALGAAIGDDIKDLAARAHSLLVSMGRRVINEGGGPELPPIPLTPEAANELSLTPNDDQREFQHAIAVILVMLELKQAIDSLSRPTSVRIDLLQGTASSWWTQHGFNHVQYRAEIASRVVTESASESGLTRQAAALLAQAAWTAGLPEAATVYVVRALDPVTEAAGPLAGAYSTLAETGRRLGAGDQVSLASVVPLTRFWLDELARRITAVLTPT
jgi:hypothetical protein